MAYDPCKLIKDVRMFLGGVSEEVLPESVIIYWGDRIDSNPDYTGDYPYILWKTTLCCLTYLIANATTTSSSTSNKTTNKEKVGNVQVELTNDFGTTESTIQGYEDLYAYYLDHPEKFGIEVKGTGGVVHIGGVNQEEVDNYRTNPNTTSIYNALPVTSFPKCSQLPYRRTVNTNRRYRR